PAEACLGVSIDLGVARAELRHIERRYMGKLGALVAEIGLEESRSKPTLHRQAVFHIVERLAKRAWERRRLDAWLWQRKLAGNAICAAKDQRTERLVRARRSVGNAELEIISLGDVLLLRRRKHGADAKRSAAILLHDVDRDRRPAVWF